MKRKLNAICAGLLCLACLPVPLSASAQFTTEEFVCTVNNEHLTEFNVALETDTFRYTGRGRQYKDDLIGINKDYYGRLETDVTDANCIVVAVEIGLDSNEPIGYIINGLTPEFSNYNVSVCAETIKERLAGKNLQVGDLLRIEDVDYKLSYPAEIDIRPHTVVEYSGNGFDIFGEDFNKILRYELYYTTWTVISGHSDLPVEKGKVTNDDEINLLDVVSVNKHLMTGYDIGFYGKLAADVDNNNEVNAVDALNILKYSIGLIESFEEIRD